MVLAEIKDLYILTEEKIEELNSTIEQFKDSVKCIVLICKSSDKDFELVKIHEVVSLLCETAINKKCLKTVLIIGENDNEKTDINLKFYDSIPELTNNIYIEENLC